MASKEPNQNKKTNRQQSTPGAPDLPVKLKKTIKEDHSPSHSTNKIIEVGDTDKSETEVAVEVSKKPTDVDQLLDSRKTDDAVADIVRKEGDELLDNYDQDAPSQLSKLKKPRRKRKWLAWTLVLLILAAATLMALPQTRYPILNKLGVRVSASLTVVDNTTGLPLKNVIVELGGNSTKTNEDGSASFEGLKQGPQDLKISRVAFSGIEKNVTLGWGSNPLGKFNLKPSGAQYTFIVRDSLANKPIEGAEVTSGQAVAKSDKDGKAVLTLGQTVSAEVGVVISAGGYRSSEVSLAVNKSDDTQVVMVPGKKAVFVSSADGKYNVYSMFIDGKDRRTILEGTGNESSDIALSVSGDGSKAAVVSTRDDIKNEGGGLLETLTLVDLGSGDSVSLGRAAEVQIIDWIGSMLIYQITLPGVADNSATRQKLISYDFSNEKRYELAITNNFTSVVSAQGAVYYATGSSRFTRINPDATDRTVLANINVQHAYRADYGTLSLNASDGWYTFDLNKDIATKTNSTNSQNRIYVADKDGKRNLWVESGQLNIYDTATGNDDAFIEQSNLSYPLRWLTDDVVVFRAGGADYAASTKGGDARKIADVTSTTGILQSY
jgi:VCBS repeat-containing protein